MIGPSRRAVVAAALAAGAASPAWGQVRRVRLRRDGPERPLPDTRFSLTPATAAPPRDGRPFTGRSLHEVTRTLFADLADPQIATTAWPESDVLRRRPNGDEAAIRAGDVMSWLLRATRGPDAHYQRLVAEGDVAACLLRQGGRRTVLIHNAGADALVIDLSSLLRTRTRILAECIETPDLAASLEDAGPAHGRLVLNDRRVTVPPWSVTRIVWDT